MNNTRAYRLVSFILCVVLIAAMALTVTGCQTAPTPKETTPTEAVTRTILGEGATTFCFDVVDKDGNTKGYEIHTDKTIVGDALQELGLIEGEPGDYGLYVKVVCGITADYNTDGTYWAFYEGSEYAVTGVDQTEIKPGATYAFKVSK